MPLFAWWLLFAVVAVAMIVGAKGLDERDRGRFSRREPDAPDVSGKSEPPSGQLPIERISLAPDAHDSGELAGFGPGVS